MSSINQRFKFFPQLKFYDEKVNTRFIPFAILSGPKNLQSDTVNTDNEGFRYSIFDNSRYAVENIKEYPETSIFLGVSTAFGVGASCDAMTVASQYANVSGGACLNLGVRGAVSIQELLHLFKALPKANTVKSIIIFSGVNDLYVNFSQKIASEFDARFEEVGSQHLAYTPVRHIVTKILGKLYRVNSAVLLPLSKRQLLLFPFLKCAEENSLSDCDRFEKLKQLQKRNFIVYAALQKQLNCKIMFALQPFFPWTNKQATEQEAMVFGELEAMQTFTDFLRVKEAIGRHNIYTEYVKILKNLSNEYGVKFYDLNPDFDSQETLFCDQVHLTDCGNLLAAQLMHRHLVNTVTP